MPIAQLCTELDLSGIGPYLLDDFWVVEQKLDGHRLIIGRDGAFNRNGDRYSSRPLPKHLSGLPLPDGVYIDGELLSLDGHLNFVAFDLFGGGFSRLSLQRRHRALRETAQALNLQVLPRVSGVDAKQRLVEQAIVGKSEGVVLKKLDSPYVGGRSSVWRKVKFVHSADCIVVGVRDDGKESFAVGLFDGEQIVDVGRCSLIGRDEVRVGDVVEITYQYATDGGRLFQPRMARVRPDKSPSECTVDQLRTTNKHLLEV